MFTQLPPLTLVGLSFAGIIVLFLLLVLFIPRLRWRLYLSMKGRTHYRIHPQGIENLPRQGGALLVCNQLLYLDWLLVLLAQKRPVRFLLFESSSAPLARKANAILLENGDLGRALQQAGDALARGELVCLFAGRWTAKNGTDLSLGHMLSVLQSRGPVPIIPVSVVQRWGSLFICNGDGVRRRSVIEHPHRVWVTFGTSLPATTTAGEVRQTLQRMTADLSLERKSRTLPVHRQFVRMASHHLFRPCLHDSSSKTTLTYGRALAGAMCLTAKLKPLLGEAPMVAVWLPPGIGSALSNVALALLRKTSVNLNYTAGQDSVQSALRQCGVRHLLTAKRFLHRVPLDPGSGVEMIYLDELMPQITSGQKLRAFLKVLLLPCIVLERWILKLGSHRADDLATIIFSSGSTGEPKGVMLSHGNLMANVESLLQFTQLTETDRLLGVLPFFHSFGFTVTFWGPLMAGAQGVFHADPRQAKEIGDLCRDHACTIFLNTPTFLRFCLRKCGESDFRTLRMLICGAEKLPPSLADDFEARFGIRPLEGYGCTELSPVVGANTPDVAFGDLTLHFNKTGSIGPPIPGVSGRVVDPDTLATLPLGQEGLLLIRGANVMVGYLNKEEMTAKVLRDCEYTTGDMARIDEDGHITLTGRLSRFAKIGGEMVPLEKIEEELHGLLQTSDRVLAVASVPDEKRGERLVVLHIELSSPPQQLCRGLSERGLPNLWVPGERDFFPIPLLPVLGTGKLDLKAVKDLALSVTRAQ